MVLLIKHVKVCCVRGDEMHSGLVGTLSTSRDVFLDSKFAVNLRAENSMLLVNDTPEVIDKNCSSQTPFELFMPLKSIIYFSRIVCLFCPQMIAYFLLPCCIAKICTMRTKMLMKSSSSEMDSFTASFFIRPLSAIRAWFKIFCTS